jgi:hypothetical protein
MTTMTIYGDDRKSISLRWVKNEIRKEAIKQGDEELRNKLWRWYYKLKDSEYEVDILVRESDVRTLLKLAVAKRWLDAAVLLLPLEFDDDDDEDGVPPRPDEATQPKSRKQPPVNDNLPKQLSFWNSEQ